MATLSGSACSLVNVHVAVGVRVQAKQGNEVELQSLFTHTILNAFLTFWGAL